MELAQFIQQYGLLFGLVLWFGIREVWPWMRDTLLPERAAAAKAEREQEQRLLERTLTAFEANTSALRALEATIRPMGEQLARLNEDMAGLYGQLDRERPSRRSRAEPEVADA